MAFTKEQQRALDLVVKDGKSVWIAGEAGTGKSYLSRELVRLLVDKYGVDKVAVTASTGVAAWHINGRTLHSFAGIKRPKAREVKLRWLYAKVIIIDEISMIDGELFDQLENLACTIRQNSAPFGGIQIVAIGDFYQLPPVTPGKPTVYAFESNAWKRTIPDVNIIVLKEVFRQKDDDELLSMLNNMRIGKPDDKTRKLLKSLDRPLPEDVEEVKLYSRKKDVEEANKQELDKLEGELHTYVSIDKKPEIMRYHQCIAPETLDLKVGARVMLIKNIDTSKGLVNGAIGIVKELHRNSVMVSFNEKDITLERNKWTIEQVFKDRYGIRYTEIIAQREQIPLILAWAITIHKSQGMTLDYAQVNLKGVFSPGQVYVALSRVKTINGLRVTGYGVNIKPDPKVVKFYKMLDDTPLQDKDVTECTL